MEDQKLPEKIFSPTSALMLGHARVEITPPIGIYHRMWGAARHDQATGVHRPMYADLLILENTEGQERVVRLQLDLVLLSNVQTDAIARSIAKSPNLLLGDELTGNLDSATSSKVMEVLVSACEAEKITTVMVTHDESLARFATRVVRLDSGKIISDEKV